MPSINVEEFFKQWQIRGIIGGKEGGEGRGGERGGGEGEGEGEELVVVFVFVCIYLLNYVEIYLYFYLYFFRIEVRDVHTILKAQESDVVCTFINNNNSHKNNINYYHSSPSPLLSPPLLPQVDRITHLTLHQKIALFVITRFWENNNKNEKKSIFLSENALKELIFFFSSSFSSLPSPHQIFSLLNCIKIQYNIILLLSIIIS